MSRLPRLPSGNGAEFHRDESRSRLSLSQGETMNQPQEHEYESETGLLSFDLPFNESVSHRSLLYLCLSAD